MLEDNVYYCGDLDESAHEPQDSVSLENYIHEREKNLRAIIEKELAEQERVRVSRQLAAHDRAKLQVSLRASLIAERNKVLWSCHQKLNNISACKDNNIKILKSVITQMKNIKTNADQDNAHAWVSSPCRLRGDDKRLHGYLGASYDMIGIDKDINKHLYWPECLNPCRLGREKVLKHMKKLQQIIEQAAREDL